jgi:hypothetical protein
MLKSNMAEKADDSFQTQFSRNKNAHATPSECIDAGQYRTFVDMSKHKKRLRDSRVQEMKRTALFAQNAEPYQADAGDNGLSISHTAERKAQSCNVHPPSDSCSSKLDSGAYFSSCQ